MPDDRERLPRLTKLLYGSGDLGFSMTSTILAVMFAIYLTDVVGLRPGAAAAAVFIGRSWDYVNDDAVFGFFECLDDYDVKGKVRFRISLPPFGG